MFNGQKITITELDEPIYAQFNTNGKTVLGVISVHDGEVVNFGKEPDSAFSGDLPAKTYAIAGNLTKLSLQKFSSYAIIYALDQLDDSQDAPETGDNSNMSLWIALLFVSGGTVITMSVYDRKRRKVVNN